MNSGFASQMISALDTLSSGFSSFTGGTITESVWNGDAADNAKNQVSEKIDPKIEAAKEKLNNLISAIQEAENARAAKANMEEAQNCITQVESSNASPDQKTREKAELEKAYYKYQTEFEASVEKVKALCS